ncbi:MAG: hypothetical protein M3Q56_06575 [Bacteroidota bacterium]|nr:hypothetical protein [Bacteroidota bacterium]
MEKLIPGMAIKNLFVGSDYWKIFGNVNVDFELDCLHYFSMYSLDFTSCFYIDFIALLF